MAYHKDLRAHIKALEAKNKLVRIKREINKDTELMPLVRWQFRGLPEEERKAFLFENVVDVTGKRYSMPVLVAAHAASRDVYAIGMMCEPHEIMQKWTDAQLHPVEPKIVEGGPVHEVVFQGDNLLERGGLEEFPVPISTPGTDNAPYFTCACWITKDPETGISNMGNYRGMIKSRTRTGVNAQPTSGLITHLEKCKQMGRPSLQTAIVMGATPAIGYTAAIHIPPGIDELTVAGGIAGEPIELVKCKTVDIEVPATAEIVIEGELPTDSLEREAPFGEYHGYMGLAAISPYFNVTCITHRRDAIYTAWISQLGPSESSKLKEMGNDSILYKFLRHDCGILSVVDVAGYEVVGCMPYCVISLRKSHHPSEVWRALEATTALSARRKIVIAVDDDIDPRDAEAVIWALTFRMQPHRDVRIIQGQLTHLDPSATPIGEAANPKEEAERLYPSPHGASALLIDATMKWNYPPVALPRKEFMERAKQIWEEEGLPKLKPKKPWYGYNLGYWTKENEEEAELALKGEHYQTGEKIARQKMKW